MHASSSCKEKTPPVTHVSRKAKSTPLSSVSTPVKENNVSVQEFHTQPDVSANITPPRSSKKPQDTKEDEIAVLRHDLASFKNSVTNEFKELRLFIRENFKQVMDAVNKSSPQTGAPFQEDGSKSPMHVPDLLNNNSMKDDNQISAFLDRPHFDINEDHTFRFVVEEHVNDKVQKSFHPVGIHIQDPLSVHEQSKGKQPVGMPSLETGDMINLQNNGIQQPQSQLSCSMFCYLASTQLIPKRALWFIQRLLLMILHLCQVKGSESPGRWNCSPYSTNFGSSSGCIMKIDIRRKKSRSGS
uniref:Putative ovule protein n=1 Tax=Solanum chacoense TaxID=4108 RepID=A0A0V0ISE6_SOLCH